MENIVLINDDFIEKETHFPELISEIKNGFSKNEVIIPVRYHHDFPNAKAVKDSTLLLMPAWNPNSNAGVKIVTINPENGKYNLPSIQGTYIYIDAATGIIKAIIEAKSLTAKRTAATSALASSFLSRKDSSSLLMIGTGALSINLIKAHTSVRPIKKVFVWGRNFEKANHICEQLQNESFSAIPIKNIEDKVSDVDIVSCATLSKNPLIFGKNLREGQHIDLVGAYNPTMRESDDHTIIKSSVFVDTFDGALKEAGDIVIPLNNGVLKESDIKADLFELSSGSIRGRKSDTEITLFKPVGHALEDLITADYFYKKFIENE